MIDLDFTAKLYDGVKKDNKQHPYEHWHASSMSECPRAHYFKRLQIPPLREAGAGKMLRWKAGHVIEEAIRPYVDGAYGGEVLSNVRFVSDKYDLTGEYDNLAVVDKELIEIKSVSGRAFKEVTSQGQVIERGLKEKLGQSPNGNFKWGVKKQPYLHHMLQQHTLKLLLDENGIECDRYKIVYVSLDGLIVTYSEKFERVHTDEALHRLRLLHKAWEDKVPPACLCNDKDHPLYDSVMFWCDFRNGNECCSLDNLKKGGIDGKE